jgi:hypothetical protein
VSLAARVLMDFDVTDPGSHLALVANHNLATLILTRQPLTAIELRELHQVADPKGMCRRTSDWSQSTTYWRAARLDLIPPVPSPH